MDSQWEAIFQYAESTPDHPYLPNVSKPVYILGRKFDSISDRDEIAEFLQSRLWMTYRKGFLPIGSVKGPKSDTGWGCMHRCGQMILAEALSRIHLGESWQWTPGIQNPEYNRIIQMFEDSDSLYSIQTITLTGVSVGKSIGSWFGPNTVAQVIKKLSVNDRWTNLVVHISVEDGIITDEIKSLCKPKSHRPDCSTTSNSKLINPTQINTDLFPNNCDNLNKATNKHSDCDDDDDGNNNNNNCDPESSNLCNDWNEDALQLQNGLNQDTELVDLRSQLRLPVTRELDSDCVEIVIPPSFDNKNISPLCSMRNPNQELIDSHDGDKLCETENNLKSISTEWKPLLLFVPLRLGITTSNAVYFDAIKEIFRIPYCIGILGGRPCHAVWIVGIVDDDIICLDPHITQSSTNPIPDNTYHCNNPIRISLINLDPSMVLGFLCITEQNFDHLCSLLKANLIQIKSKQFIPLLEIHQTRPFNLPPLLPSSSSSTHQLNDLSISIYTFDDLNNKPITHQNQLLDINSIDSNHLHHQQQHKGEDDDEGEEDKGKLTETINGMKKLWSECSRMAINTVNNLIHTSQESSME